MIQRIGRTLGWQRGKISHVYELISSDTLDEKREEKRDVEHFYNEYEGYERELQKARFDRILYSIIDAIDIFIFQKINKLNMEQLTKILVNNRMKNPFESITNLRENIKRSEIEFNLIINKLSEKYKYAISTTY